MSTEINTSSVFNQDEEIDYLKGYRKKKIKAVIFAVFLTTLILLTIVMSMLVFLQNAEIFINVNDVNVAFTQKVENVEPGKDRLTFLTTPLNKKCELKYYTYEVTKDLRDKSMHIKIVGKYPFGEPAASFYSVDIDTSIKKNYLEDKKGNLLELWDKDTGFLVEDISNAYKVNM